MWQLSWFSITTSSWHSTRVWFRDKWRRSKCTESSADRESRRLIMSSILCSQKKASWYWFVNVSHWRRNEWMNLWSRSVTQTSTRLNWCFTRNKRHTPDALSFLLNANLYLHLSLQKCAIVSHGLSRLTLCSRQGWEAEMRTLTIGTSLISSSKKFSD